MFFLGKDNKLWYYDGGYWTFITFVRAILNIIDDRNLLYVANDKKCAGETQIIYFNRRMKYFKQPPENVDTTIKEAVLNISNHSTSVFTRDSTYLIGSIKTDIDPEKYTLIYKDSVSRSDHNIFGRGYDFCRHMAYYIKKQAYYQDEIIVYCYIYDNIKSNAIWDKKDNSYTIQKIIKLSGRYYHESREFLTNDEHYISLINEEKYEKIYPNLFATIAYKNEKYYIGNNELTLDPEFILE